MLIDAKKFVQDINNLPTPSLVLNKISAVISNEKCSAKDLIEALKLDPAICSKVLRLANSAYIGLPGTVSSLQNAVVILGNQRIYSLVVASVALSSLAKNNFTVFKIMDFWRHSVTVAIVAESIAKHVQRYDVIDIGDVFCAGILHDIGKLALASFADDILKDSYEKSLMAKIPFYESENDLPHTLVGYELAKKWDFPNNLSYAIKNHHNLEVTDKMTAIIYLSDIMVHLLGFTTFPKEITPKLNQNILKYVGLQPERLRVIATNTLENEKQIESLIEFVS